MEARNFLSDELTEPTWLEDDKFDFKLKLDETGGTPRPRAAGFGAPEKAVMGEYLVD